MMKLTTVAGLALVAACAVQAPTGAYPAPGYSAPPASCDIRAAATPTGLRLEAVTYADRSLQGDYDFVVTAMGSGGSSDIRQGGPLELVAGEQATIGLAELPTSQFRAALTVRDAAGEICHAERSS